MKYSVLYALPLPLLFATGCLSATLEDDITVTKQLDFSSNVQQIQSNVVQLQQLCQQLPSACSVSGLIPLSQEKDIDVSDQLKKFNDTKYGMSYSISNVELDISSNADAGEDMSHVGALTVMLGDCTLVNATKQDVQADKFSVLDVACVQNTLSAGPTKLIVDITLQYADVDDAVKAVQTLPTTFETTLSMHVEVSANKKL